MQVLNANQFVLDQRPAVVRHATSIARRWRGHIEVDDLIGVGLLATLRAAESFDASRSVPFSVHAARAARWAMLSEARTHALVRRGAIERRRALLAAEAAIEQRTGGTASTADVAGELGMPIEAVRRWRRETAASERGTVDDLENALAGVEASPEDQLVSGELLAALRTAVEALPPKLRWVIQATYLDGRILADVAAELGVTESRVSQLRAEAVTLLREGLRILLDGDDPQAAGFDRSTAHLSKREPRRLREYRQALAGANV